MKFKKIHRFIVKGNPRRLFKFLNSLNKRFKGKRGFTVVGVTVASAIGLIVAGGMARMMSQTVQQQRAISQANGLINFFGDLQSIIDIKKTLIAYQNGLSASDKAKLAKGETSNPIYIIKDSSNADFIDVGTQTKSPTGAEACFPGSTNNKEYKDKNNQLSSLGVCPRHWILQCAESGGCNCQTTGTNPHSYTPIGTPPAVPPCKKKWELAPVIQDTESNLLFKNSWIYTVEISWASAPASPYTSFQTDEVAGQGTLNALNECITAEAGGTKKTLIGCGQTQSLGGTHTTALGHHKSPYTAPTINSGAEGNFFLGYKAGELSSLSAAADKNAFFGPHAAHKATITGQANVFVGNYAGSGTGSVKTGVNATYSQISGTQNSFFGSQAGWQSKVSGTSNSFFGTHTGKEAKVSGNHNSFLGSYAGQNATVSGDANVFIGDDAGIRKQNTYTQGSVSGTKNVFVGHAAGRGANVDGNWNSFFGAAAGQRAKLRDAGSNNKADGNTFVGSHAGQKADLKGGAKHNSFFGAEAGESATLNSSATHNTFVGASAGISATLQTNAQRNTFIGDGAGHTATIDHGKKRNVFIGYLSGHNEIINSDDGTYIRGKLLELKGDNIKLKGNNLKCAAGQYLRGFNADGTLDCHTAARITNVRTVPFNNTTANHINKNLGNYDLCFLSLVDGSGYCQLSNNNPPAWVGRSWKANCSAVCFDH